MENLMSLPIVCPDPSRPGTRVYVCCHAAPSLRVRASFRLTCFLAKLEAHRSRELRILPAPAGVLWASAWLAGEATDWIVYAGAVTPARRVHLILHQAAHILLAHKGIPLSGPMLGALLFPDLESKLIRCLASRQDPDCGVATGDEHRQAATLARQLARQGEVLLGHGIGTAERPAA
jgi:hypothetical protein